MDSQGQVCTDPDGLQFCHSSCPFTYTTERIFVITTIGIDWHGNYLHKYSCLTCNIITWKLHKEDFLNIKTKNSLNTWWKKIIRRRSTQSTRLSAHILSRICCSQTSEAAQSGETEPQESGWCSRDQNRECDKGEVHPKMKLGSKHTCTFLPTIPINNEQQRRPACNSNADGRGDIRPWTKLQVYTKTKDQRLSRHSKDSNTTQRKDTSATMGYT